MLSCLALPWQVRCRVVQAAGVTAAIYGAAVATLSDTALRLLRENAMRACLRTRCRAAPEAVYLLLGALWRVDVSAVAVIGTSWHVPLQQGLARWVFCGA